MQLIIGDFESFPFVCINILHTTFITACLLTLPFEHQQQEQNVRSLVKISVQTELHSLKTSNLTVLG